MSLESSLDFLIEYYDKKITRNMKALYLKKLGVYPEDTVKHAIDEAMETQKYFPRLSILKEIISKYSSPDNYVVYDRDSDPRFPVNLMWAGYNILVSKDEHEFNQYCENVNMPLDDRERIIDKKRMSYSVEELTNNMLEVS